MRVGRPPARAALVGAGVAVAILVAGACGVSSEGQPRTIAAGDVPFDLLEPPASVATTTSTVAPRAAAATVSIFLLQGGRLTATTRQVPSPPDVRTVLERLLEGPNEAEARSGLQSAISPTTRILDVTVEGAVVRVNLSSTFAESQASDQTAAVAQIVFTATGLPGVSGVTLALAGRAVEVPAADGTLRRGTLTPADYAALASPRPPAT